MENIQELVQNELSQPNYLIEHSKATENYTVIYFSSNGIFGENDLDLFKKKIVEKNTFEFYKTRIKKASKHIFLRDITLKWYKNGINNNINSFEKLLEFLKEETKDSKVITLGSSAGGYAAVLFGALLNAEYIFSFSGQFILSDSSIIEYVKNYKSPIFYLYPIYYDLDENQYESIKDFKNVYILPLKSATHGVGLTKETLNGILNSDIKTLKKMYNNKAIGERVFLIKHFGVIKFLKRMINKNIQCLKNKYP